MPLKGFSAPKKNPRATPADERKLDRPTRLREFHRLAGKIDTLNPIRPRGEDGKRAARTPKETVTEPKTETKGEPKTEKKTEDVPPEAIHGWDKPLRKGKE